MDLWQQWHPGAARSCRTAFFYHLIVTVLVAAADDGSRHTNVWAVQMAAGISESDVHGFAAGLGFSRVHRIIRQSDGDVYLFEHADVPEKALQPDTTQHHRLRRSNQVVWAEQQVAKIRVKRDLHFNDPSLPDAWYLNKGAHDGYDLNVHAAWEHGYSGKGAVVTILDDGLEWRHPDLRENYDPDASTDINNSTHGLTDGDPTPRYDYSNENRHGTRCAGEVSAMANNGVCSVGVAFGSKIGGVRMLDGDVTDAVEAQSLRFNTQHIDVYSASWGPDDNGRTVDGPGPLAKDAFINGIEKGRGGKGSIFVWASGNGGLSGDSCACDGYTNSIYTLSVSSTSEMNTRPWYLEECASTITTTYSSGSNYGSQRQIVTTDLNGLCTKRHTGTSASAPLAAAVVALSLEANPHLTWRDVQYIMLMTSNPKPLEDGQWQTNGVGRQVSHLYGYGLVDAFAAVKLAANWTTVPARYVQELPVQSLRTKLDGQGFSGTIHVPACPRRRAGGAVPLSVPVDTCVRYLEHVQLVTTATFSRRGDLTIILKSPSGTASTLLPPRSADRYEGGFNSWPFMSVHFWGESPAGDWTVELRDAGGSTGRGYLTSYQLVLHGTALNPLHGQPVEVRCHPECEPPCDGYGANQCDSCKRYRMGKDGPCVESCPTNGYYIDDDATGSGAPAGVCVPCYVDCQTCEGEKATECVACKAGLLLDSAVSQQCVTHCPTSTWPDPESGECRPCLANCSACRDGSACSLCAAGHVWLEAKGACVVECSAGQYYDLASSGCHSCDSSCHECTGPSTKECSSCSRTEYFYNGSCVITCPEGFFSSRRLCKRCHDSCRTCSAPDDNNCHSCRTGHLLTEHNKCVEAPACVKGFVDTVSGACSPCHVSCDACDGSTAEDCLACPLPRLLVSGRCVQTCPDGYFERRLQQQQAATAASTAMAADGPSECAACYSPACSHCTGNTSSDCMACSPPNSLTRPSAGCDRWNCSRSTFLASTGGCQTCHKSCAECLGPLDTDCLSCPAGLALHQGRCVVSCPAGSYTASRPGHHVPLCLACHSTCKTCSGASKKECLDCTDGMILKDSRCIVPPTCYSKQYYQPTAKECQPCDSSCATCTGPAPSECLTCVAPLHYFLFNHTCVVCCSPEFVDVPCCYCISTSSGMMCNLISEPTNGIVGGQGAGGAIRLVLPRNFVIVIVAICLGLFALYGLLFAVLQARSNRRLCWSSGPTFGQKRFVLPVSVPTDMLYSQVKLYGADDDDDDNDDGHDETKLGPQKQPRAGNGHVRLNDDED